MTWSSQFRSAVRRHVADPGYFAERYGECLRSWWREQQQSKIVEPVVWPRSVQVFIDLANTPAGSVMVVAGACLTFGIILREPGHRGFLTDLTLCIAALVANSAGLNIVFYLHKTQGRRLFDPLLACYILYFLAFVMFAGYSEKLHFGSVFTYFAFDFSRGWRRALRRTIQRGRLN